MKTLALLVIHVLTTLAKRAGPGGAKENARILYENSEKSAAEACAIAGVGRRTFFSDLAKLKKTHASGS